MEPCNARRKTEKGGIPGTFVGGCHLGRPRKGPRLAAQQVTRGKKNMATKGKVGEPRNLLSCNTMVVIGEKGPRCSRRPR